MQQAAESNYYRRAQFLLSVHKLNQLPEDVGGEVAFAGRSNAGKSSAINAICEIGNLARTSKTPGRTQLLNFFQLDETRRLVDLPGYGYAKVPEAMRRHWEQTLEAYLRTRQTLHGLILIMDVRHPLTEFDRRLLEWCRQAEMPAHILLTKADKLKRGPAKSTLLQVRRVLEQSYPQTTAQLFSSLKKEGLEEARRVLDRWLEVPKDRTQNQ